MSVHAPYLPCYLVEWYWPEFTAADLDATVATLERCVAAICTEGTSVQLLMTLAVPTDEVLFGVFAASTAETVAEACRRAGVPAERLTKALDTRLADQNSA